MRESNMKSLQDLLNGWRSSQSTGENTGMAQWLQHPVVQAFVEAHSEVKKDQLERAETKLYQAVRDADSCSQCPGLHRCPNLVKGHRARLIWTGAYIENSLAPCSKWEADQQQKKREKLIQSHHIPKHILEARFKDIEQDRDRYDAIEAVYRFCLTVQPGEPDTKGIYLYGPFGVGKSYIMGAAAQELAKRDIHSFMIYTPDFFREMKQAIQDQSLYEKMEALKQVPVLILDDIGSETISPWTRDEVLSPILQYRVSENLPTLYTSNYDYQLLEDHLGYSDKGGFEEMKAKRLMERIRHYTDIYAVKGLNRR